VWVCVVSDFLGLNFDVFFRSFRRFFFFGVKLFLFFEESCNLCVWGWEREEG
jgi:hypothetical protein